MNMLPQKTKLFYFKKHVSTVSNNANVILKMSRSRVGSSNSQKIAATSSIIATRKDKSFSSRIKKPLDNGFTEQFKSFCTELGITDTPKVKILFSEPEYGFQEWSTPKTKIASKISKNLESSQILIVLNTETNDEIDIVILKQYRIENDLLCALQKTFDMQQSIRVLKLEFCNLNHQQIKAVKYLLQQNWSIEDLSLNGNPNKYQNFYIILKNTNLLYLSLKFCQINDRGIEKIAQCLTDSFTQTLLAINLASNYITDDGVQHIANALRSNRCLIHLNLADNYLTNYGCTRLMDVFQKFLLEHSEIIIRRKRNLSNFLKTMASREESKLNNSRKSSSYNLSKIIGSPRKSKSQTRKSSKDKMSMSSGSSFKKKKVMEKKYDESIIQLPKDNHPFVAECYPENKEIYCRGNLKLSYLNLAYNKISVEGLQVIADVLKYQSELNESGSLSMGLRRLILEGNNLLGCDIEIETISDLMNQKSNRRNSVQFSRLSNRSANRKLVSMKTI